MNFALCPQKPSRAAAVKPHAAATLLHQRGGVFLMRHSLWFTPNMLFTLMAKLSILVSSDHRTFLQLASVSLAYLLADSYFFSVASVFFSSSGYSLPLQHKVVTGKANPATDVLRTVSPVSVTEACTVVSTELSLTPSPVFLGTSLLMQCHITMSNHRYLCIKRGSSADRFVFAQRYYQHIDNM